MTRILACAALLATWAIPAAAPAAVADDPALAAIEACRARLDARVDVGLERIEKRCPDLLPAIERAPWAGLVPHDLRARRDELSAAGLAALAELVRGADRELAAHPAPDVDELRPLLAALGEQGQAGATRWERFKRWLAQKLERRDERDDEDSWLEEFARQFETSEGVARVVTYAGYSAVVVLVILVILGELRALGLLGARRRLPEQAEMRARWMRPLRVEDIARAPLAERPGLLLRLLGEALTRANRLPAADGLTASAIASRARLDAESDREALAQVAATADRVRYGDRPVAEDALDRASRAAAALLDRLGAGREKS